MTTSYEKDCAEMMSIPRKILDAEKDGGENLTFEKIQELHDGVQKRIEFLREKAEKRLEESRKNKKSEQEREGKQTSGSKRSGNPDVGPGISCNLPGSED